LPVIPSPRTLERAVHACVRCLDGQEDQFACELVASQASSGSRKLPG
jgi:hypothetical protein